MAFPWLGCQQFQTRSCQVAVTSIVRHCCLVQRCIDVSFRCIEISVKEGHLPAEVNLSFESGWIAAAESIRKFLTHPDIAVLSLKNPGLLCCIWRYSGQSLQRLLGFQVPRLGNLHADGGTHLGEKTKTKQQIQQKFRRNFWIRFVSTLYIFLLCFLGFCSMHVFRDQSQTPPGFCHRKNTWLNNFSWTAASLQSMTIYFYYLYLKQTALCVATLGGSQIPALHPPGCRCTSVLIPPGQVAGERRAASITKAPVLQPRSTSTSSGPRSLSHCSKDFKANDMRHVKSKKLFMIQSANQLQSATPVLLPLFAFSGWKPDRSRHKEASRRAPMSGLILGALRILNFLLQKLESTNDVTWDGSYLFPKVIGYFRPNSIETTGIIYFWEHTKLKQHRLQQETCSGTEKTGVQPKGSNCHPFALAFAMLKET